MLNKERLQRAQERMQQQGIDAYLIRWANRSRMSCRRCGGWPAGEGMTLTVGHSVLSLPGVGGVRLEDTFHIAPDGAEALTDSPAGLAWPPAPA